MEEKIAHVRDVTLEPQPLLEHLYGVAKFAECFAERITPYKDFGYIGYLLGLLHDVGKYQKGFQRYICKESGIDPSLEAWRTPHSPAGALYVDKYLNLDGGGPNLNKLLSLCIASHHRGLYNDDEYRYLLNLGETRKGLKELLQGLQDDSGQLDMDIKGIPLEKIRDAWNRIDEEDYPLLIRMLFSCLVDADFLDTERFMSFDKSNLRQSPTCTLEKMREKIEEYVLSFNRMGRINEARSSFLQQCRRHGQEALRGFYSLTLPTGAGKTVSSMMWALQHAIARGCERIIYVIPYTSIITQTAQIFKEIFGEDNVLEHHSDVNVGERDDEAMEKKKLETENWDVPLVVTTNVQFFESLYSHRVSRCRKLHNICNSVVVFDEVQMFPPGLLNPILRTVESLHYSFRVEPLFCTATLPVFDRDILSDSKRIGHEFFFLKESIKEVVPYDKKLFAPFDKVTYHWTPFEFSTHELVERLSQHPSFLCIVNSRKDAARLYDALRTLSEEGEELIHLSRRMCSAHIQERILQIRERLSKGRPVRVVSTQLVEAGVDFDFPVVYRALAGLDSVIQAAGRCNREGRMKEPGDVYIFRLTDGTSSQGEMSWAQGALEDLLDRLADIGGPQREEIERYYQAFYRDVGSFDSYQISDKLWGEERCEELRFDFQTASENFKYIKNDMKQIVVPYGEEGRKLVDKLQRSTSLDRNDYRRLHQFSVGLNEKERLSLKESILTSNADVDYLFDEHLYNENTGIEINGVTLEPLLL